MAKRKQIDESVFERILSMRKEGKTLKGACAELGIHPATYCGWQAKKGIRIDRHGNVKNMNKLKPGPKAAHYQTIPIESHASSDDFQFKGSPESLAKFINILRGAQ